MTPRACLCGGLVLTLLGCASEKGDSGPTCSGQVQQPLYNASSVESYLGLAENEQRALVAIVDETNDGALCSGAFIAGTWVLTAAHCDELVKAVVVVAPGARTPSARLPVVRRELHPSADIALFQVDFSSATFGDEHSAPDAPALDASGLDISPLSMPSAELTRLVPGVPVELAGYGLTEQGDTGALRFLVEQLVAATPSTLTVAGFGNSGACEGDSGSPLLMRQNGLPTAAGVLWGGSATCLHEDEYIRTDATDVQQWITNIAGVAAASVIPAPECGGISAEGRCLYGSALWCNDGSLVAEQCDGNRGCGWSSAESGFRCVSLGAPCSGVDDTGECRAGQVVRCVHGKTQTASCSACDTCRVSAQTGVPYCTANSDW